MSRPVRIGITTSFAGAAQSLDARYPRAVEAAGGLPIIAPIFKREETARAFAALLDGLIITGGPGITRSLIGRLPPDLPAVSHARDRSDEMIFRAMADRPLLGICYGMQFANALAGGSIYGDVAGAGEFGRPQRRPRGNRSPRAYHAGQPLGGDIGRRAPVDQYPPYTSAGGFGRGTASDGARRRWRH